MFPRESFRSSLFIVLTLVTLVTSFIPPVAAQRVPASGGIAGRGNSFGLPGPVAEPARQGDAAIDVKKFVSVDGQITWQDANEAPGPDIALEADVSFRLIVTNQGSVALTNLSLTDSAFDVSSCPLPTTLDPGAFFECTIGPFPANEGQHTDTALATGEAGGATVSATDTANYFGGDRPSIDLEKLISVDGGVTWQDANSPPGPRAELEGDVFFKFVVANNGNIPLTGISLVDDSLDVSSCTLPATLDPTVSFECVVGPAAAGEGQVTNTATAGGAFNGVSYTDTDKANYFGGEGELPVTIVIEGPVVQINVNVIVIFGFNIEIEPDDPLLTVIKVGDMIRVEGSLDQPMTLEGQIVVIAVNVVLINVNIYVNTDGQQVWRDEGNCKNPPPPWAPANGWRRRCENHQGDDDD